MNDGVGLSGAPLGSQLGPLTPLTVAEVLRGDALSFAAERPDAEEPAGLFYLEGAQLCFEHDALELGSAQLRCLGEYEGRSRYVLTTPRLTGALCGHALEVQGTSTLEIEIGEDGAVASVQLSNPSTVSLLRADRTLAITDGRVRADYDDPSRPVLHIDALKAGLRDGGDLLTVELGRITLALDGDGAGRMQVTGKAIRGRFAGAELVGDDVGLEVTLRDGGAAEAIFATGRALTLGDGVSSLIAHEASVGVTLDARQRFATLHHEVGMTELCSSEFGTLTLRNCSTLELAYQGERLAALQIDTEELAWTQADGSQLDLRDAGAMLEVDERAVPRRAILDSGVLAWRGNDGVEVTSFGFGAQIEFSSSGAALRATAGAQGATLSTNGGVLQIDVGRLEAEYEVDGSFREAKVEAQRIEYLVSSGGAFRFEGASVRMLALSDGGTRANIEAVDLRFENGEDQMALSDVSAALTQDTEGRTILEAAVEAGTVHAAAASFTLQPGSEFEVEMAEARGFARIDAWVVEAHGRAGTERLRLAAAHFAGELVGGELGAFCVDGALSFARGDRISLESESARLERALEDECEVRLAVTSGALSVRTPTREFALENGTVELVEDTALLYLREGRLVFCDGGAPGSPLDGAEVLLSFTPDGVLIAAELLGVGAFLRGAFGVLRAIDGQTRARFVNDRVSEIEMGQGALALELLGGIAVELERASATIDYDEAQNPTLVVEHGRALMLGEFGRLTLPEGFELTARTEHRRVLLSGTTPNARLEADADVRTLNDFTLLMEVGPEGFEQLTLSGSAHFDDGERKLHLTNGVLQFDYDRTARRLIGRGTTESLSVHDGALAMRPRPGGAELEVADQLWGTLGATEVELVLQGGRLAWLHFEAVDGELHLDDDQPRSTRLEQRKFSLERREEGRVRLHWNDPS